jgi:ABC-type uncharacterized transport system substrate-binding protein
VSSANNNEAFKQGLREHGYVEGDNIVLERRYGETRIERMAENAAELVRMRVDVIVAVTDPVIAAAKRQTNSIPIVMVNSTDPVGTKFVASLARPGGNVTGLSTMSPALGGKRLELLREAMSKLSRVAVMWNPDVRGALLDYKELEEPARLLRLQLQSVEVSHAEDLARAFSAIANARAEAVIVISPDAVTFANRVQLASFAQKNRLLSMHGQQEYVDAGGLMAYGVSSAAGWRRAATYVDKILKGRQAGRPAGRAAHQVRARHQPQDREGARVDDSAVAAAASGPRDPMMCRTGPAFRRRGLAGVRRPKHVPLPRHTVHGPWRRTTPISMPSGEACGSSGALADQLMD